MQCMLYGINNICKNWVVKTLPCHTYTKNFQHPYWTYIFMQEASQRLLQYHKVAIIPLYALYNIMWFSIAGSCSAAGHSSCCVVGSCKGEPPNCYCDSLCQTFKDCCNDAITLCQTNNNISGRTRVIGIAYNITQNATCSTTACMQKALLPVRLEVQV